MTSLEARRILMAILSRLENESGNIPEILVYTNEKNSYEDVRLELNRWISNIIH